ncbi:DUF6990 domain-containing protein [Antarctobacter sp.]|uniref:DUF6990 domain-containing protein n=1 Tax=Antarctobacter sp. TaxID=1872577 RepID=UPI002B266124|nr:hypothetical protein [Antarctobacter sp.]
MPLTTRPAVLQAFQALGWQKTGRGQDARLHLDLPDRTVSVIPHLSQLPDSMVLRLHENVSTQRFDEGFQAVDGSQNTRPMVPLILRGGRRAKHPHVTATVIADEAARLIEWAAGHDLDALYAGFRNLPTDAVGSQPLYHLVALGLQGDVTRLTGYLDAFRAGDRLSFVPYITEDMVARALTLAETTAERAD